MITKTASASDKLTYKLPTTVNVSFDYNIDGNLYIGAMGGYALNKGKKAGGKTHKNNYLLVTPRYEGKIFGAYLPVGFNELSGFNAGIGLRMGPLTLGSGSILSTLMKGETKSANFYLSLRFGILQKNRFVVEKVNEIEQQVARIDNDGDGLYDEIDSCPTEAGTEANKGCPDRDGDGLVDNMDNCPDVAGIEKYQGCPIPDSDGDGINDEEDKCPNVAGVAKYQGCPIPDSDGDGVNDEEDNCPTVAGIAENKGCPAISKEIINKVELAAKNVFFATGSSTLLKKSYTSLNDVAEVMKQDSALHLQIDGYTDSQGDDAKNQILSEKRANAVKSYLVSKGIAEIRLSATGFGEQNPVADNNTVAGRAQNRRTEMTIRNQ